MDNALTTRVSCYAGSTSPEHPRAFHWQGRAYAVQEILHRWRTPQGLGFYVHCVPGDSFFNLFYDTQEDTWYIQPGDYDMMVENHHHQPNLQGD